LHDIKSSVTRKRKEKKRKSVGSATQELQDCGHYSTLVVMRATLRARVTMDQFIAVGRSCYDAAVDFHEKII
jgi:hypothetical protein